MNSDHVDVDVDVDMDVVEGSSPDFGLREDRTTPAHLKLRVHPRQSRGGSNRFKRRAWCLAMLLGCSPACTPKDYVAELMSKNGSVQGLSKAQAATWKATDVGHRFTLGSGVRTTKGARATIRFKMGGGLRLGPETTVRFLSKLNQGAPGVEIEAGEAEIDSSEEPIYYESRIGKAVIAPGARVRLKKNKDESGVDVHVLMGFASVTESGKSQKQFGRGEVIRIGAAEIEPAPDKPKAQPPDKPSIEFRLKRGRGRVRLDEEARWKKLTARTSTLPEGGQVRLWAKGLALAKRGQASAEIHGPATVTIGTAEILLKTTQGRLVLKADDSDVAIRVPGGVALAKKGGTRASVRVDKRGRTRVSVDRGSLVLQGKDARDSVEYGEAGTLTANGVVSIARPLPTRSDFAVVAGESLTAHHPTVPTPIRVRFNDICPDQGILEVTRSRTSFRKSLTRARGSGSAIVLIPQGSFRYRVRCASGDKVAKRAKTQGSIRLIRDRGTKRLPRSPPQNTLEADGRHYTVYYQNHLPALTFTWPDAPSSGGFTLHLQPERGAKKKYKIKKAQRAFKSGRIREGVYRWWFESGEQTKKQSATTTLRVDFDNATPALYLRSPKPGERIQGDTVRVSGATIEGSIVSVDGVVLDQDRHQRFSAEVPLPKNEDALAVRIEHPRIGIHYYLRKLSASR